MKQSTIEKLQNLAVSMQLVTVEDMQKHSIPQLVTMIANKMNELIQEVYRFEGDVSDVVKTQNDNIQYLLGEGLHLEVATVFENWMNDGTFDTLINHSALKKVNERIDETNTQLSNKANKNDIFTMANMGQDVKEAMTGGSVAVVGKNSILNDNIVDKAIDESKIEFITTDKYIKISVNDITGKGYLKPDGTIDGGLGFDITNYIAVDESTEYEVNCHRNTVFYNADKVVISNYETSTTVTESPTKFITPYGCKYIRTNLLLEKVSLIDYKLKKTNYTAKLQSQIKINNDNLEEDVVFYEKNMNFLTAVKNNVYNKSSNSIGELIQNDGSFISHGMYSTTAMINAKLGFEYEIPCHRRIVFYDEGGVVVRYTENVDAPNEVYKFKVKRGEVGFKVAIPKLYGITDDNFYVKEIGYCLNANINVSSSFTSKWRGKRWMQIGDSITFQDGRAYESWVGHETQIARGYQTVVNELVGGFDANVNKSQGGTPMTNNGNNSGVAIALRQDYANYDLVTFAHGTNDFKLNMPLGTLGKVSDTVFDDKTFYGAYRKAIEYALTNNPNLRLILITPLQRNNDGYTTESTNSVGCKLVDYVSAIREIGEMYGLPILDMYKCGEFNKFTLGTFTYDGLHPTDAGYKVYGEKLYNLIEYSV